MKILVVDDNSNNLKLFRLILEKSGYQGLTAADGKTGLRLARAELPDLIFMDIQMPIMDGIQVLQQLRQDENTKNIPVIALTSHAMNGDRQKFMTYGFDEYLSKPIRKEKLLKAVAKFSNGER